MKRGLKVIYYLHVSHQQNSASMKRGLKELSNSLWSSEPYSLNEKRIERIRFPEPMYSGMDDGLNEKRIESWWNHLPLLGLTQPQWKEDWKQQFRRSPSEPLSLASMKRGLKGRLLTLSSAEIRSPQWKEDWKEPIDIPCTPPLISASMKRGLKVQRLKVSDRTRDNASMKRGLKALNVTPDETELMCLNEKRIERHHVVLSFLQKRDASMKRGLKGCICRAPTCWIVLQPQWKEDWK